MAITRPISNIGAHISSGGLARFIPEPRSNLSFQSVLQGVGSLLSGGVSSIAGLDSNYQELLLLQMQTQQEMQTVSMISNIEKSKHETQMAAVRNIRVG